MFMTIPTIMTWTRIFAIPLIVGVSTYVQQKMSVTPNANPQQAQQQQMMAWMMPMMLVFITLSLPSGVGVYWVVTNVFSLFVSYYVYGRSAFTWRQLLLPGGAPAPAPAPSAKKPDDDEEAAPSPKAKARRESAPETPAGTEPQARDRYGKRRGKRKNRR